MGYPAVGPPIETAPRRAPYQPGDALCELTDSVDAGVRPGENAQAHA
jgi:hypothetical protein